MVAKENERARTIARHIDNEDPTQARIVALKSPAPFVQLNDLLRLGTLTVSLENSEGEEILARHGGDGTRFSIEKMSDGERSAAIMAASVLTAEPETVFLIDEPELHLHRSIIEPFVSAVLKQRRDCVFVISTHEISLPVANPDARILLVRSCTWNGDSGGAWDLEVLEPNTELPEELKRDVLGSRRRILFVEGASNSLDLPLYSALFPGISVVPKGSCTDVQRVVSGLHASYNYHHCDVFGLIDKDDRTPDEIRDLASRDIFALEVCSAESLYYCSDAIAAVACRQAESLGLAPSEMISTANQKVLEILGQEGLAQRMAARRCHRYLRDRALAQLPGWRDLMAEEGESSKVSVSIDSPYPDELRRFRELVSSSELDSLIARYPLRETPVFQTIARILRCQSREDYERIVVSRIRNGDDLAEKIKSRIEALSNKLAILNPR